MVLDLLAPLLVYLLLKDIFENDWLTRTSFLVIFVLIVSTLKPMHWGRRPWTQSYFDVQIPKIANLDKPTIVIQASTIYPKPMGFLRTFLPSQWRFVGIDFLIGPDKYWDQFLKKIPNLTDYQWYMLFHEPPKTELFEKFGQQAPEPCYQIKTKIGSYFLCKIFPTKYLPNQI